MLASLKSNDPLVWDSQRVFPLDAQESDFFSILLDRSFPGRRKRVGVDQLLVCG